MLAALFCFAHNINAQAFPITDTTTVYAAKATYYADKFVGRKTSNGEIFSQNKYTAAHHSIKLGTLVMVTNPKNGRQVIVRINDRCPRRGIIDLTRSTIGIKGTGSVTIRILPTSYHYAWEHQDEMIALEGGRQVLVPENVVTQSEIEQEPTTAEPNTQPAEKPSATQTDKRPQKPTPPIEQPKEEAKKQATPAPQPHKTQPDPNARYDILLATGIPRSQAEHYINKIPMGLRENAQLKPDRTSGKLVLTLSLSTTHKKALTAQKSVIKTFPNCQIIQSN